MNEELDKFENADLGGPAVGSASIHFDVTIQEANLIFSALAELPHRVADPMMRKLSMQAQAQQSVQ